MNVISGLQIYVFPLIATSMTIFQVGLHHIKEIENLKKRLQVGASSVDVEHVNVLKLKGNTY